MSLLRGISTIGWFVDVDFDFDLLSVSTKGWFQAPVLIVIESDIDIKSCLIDQFSINSKYDILSNIDSCSVDTSIESVENNPLFAIESNRTQLLVMESSTD